MNETDDLIAKGIEGEKKFGTWLDQSCLAYLYIKQDPESFAQLFKDAVKRPDYLVLINSIGLLAVDVKNRSMNSHYGYFTLDKESELKQTLAFERIFRLPFWYVYLEESETSICWYWISALKAVECGVLREGKRGEYFKLKKNEFAKVTTVKDMGRLFSQILPSISDFTD